VGRLASLARRPSAAAAASLRWLLGLFARTCFWVSSWPAAARELAPMPWTSVLAYYCLVCSVLALPRAQGRLRPGALRRHGVGGGGDRRPGPRALPEGGVSSPAPRRGRPGHLPGSENCWSLSGGPAGTVLKALRFYGVGRLRRAVLFGPKAEEAFARISESMPVEEASRFEGPPPEVCEGPVCFGFAPPGVRRGKAEYSYNKLALESAGPSRSRRTARESKSKMPAEKRIKSAILFVNEAKPEAVRMMKAIRAA